jgi:hypothetical protein
MDAAVKVSAQPPRRPAPEGRSQLSEAEQSQDGEQDDAGRTVLAGHDKSGKDEDRQGGADCDHPDPEASGRERRQVHSGEATPCFPVGRLPAEDGRPQGRQQQRGQGIQREPQLLDGQQTEVVAAARPCYRFATARVDWLLPSGMLLPVAHQTRPRQQRSRANSAVTYYTHW